MTALNRLTVIIPCKNERRNIRPCIESIRGIAAEILVADSGSTDGTLEIVRGMGNCRVVEREYVHSGDFKNWAIPQAAHPWVLILDADERVTKPLADEIQRVLDSPDKDGYWIYRNNYFMGHRVRYSGWQSDKVLRLFRRDLGRYVGDTDHAEVAVSSNRVGFLKNRLEHFTYWSYDQYLGKLQRYTTHQAKVWHTQGRRASALQLALRGPLRFLRAYIFQLGFLDGMVGIQISAMTGFYAFMKQARLWEIQSAHSQPEPEGRVLDTRPSAQTDRRPMLKTLEVGVD